jgi:hypothetical protein
MVNADLRSSEVIKRTIGIDMPSVAEIGVYKGDMARGVFFSPNLIPTMIDPCGEYIADSYKDSGDAYAMHTKEEWEEVKAKALDSVSWAKNRVRVYQGTSEGAADYFSDDKFDLVFIDGDHSYEQTKKDIAAWWDKVADGGYLGGHDYRDDKNYGVIQAVDEFVANESFKTKNQLTLEHGENMTWFVHKWES